MTPESWVGFGIAVASGLVIGILGSFFKRFVLPPFGEARAPGGPSAGADSIERSIGQVEGAVKTIASNLEEYRQRAAGEHTVLGNRISNVENVIGALRNDVGQLRSDFNSLQVLLVEALGLPRRRQIPRK